LADSLGGLKAWRREVALMPWDPFDVLWLPHEPVLSPWRLMRLERRAAGRRPWPLPIGPTSSALLSSPSQSSRPKRDRH